VWLDEWRALPPLAVLLDGAPLRLLALLSTAFGLGAGLVVLGVLPGSGLGVLGIVVGHGALLATALCLATDDPRTKPRVGAVAVGLIALGALGAALTPWGWVAHLLIPGWLFWRGRQGGLARLGLQPPIKIKPALFGLAVGAALGGHLLLSAAGTLGYRLRGDGLVAYLAALAYDAGANVPSSELFFRGALFNRAQRHTTFAVAAALATTGSLLRYALDPLLPKNAEVLLGTLFYVTLLGATNAWLLWWSGSLLPGLLAALVFFGAYRLLAVS
jgi:hypothetical protein